VSTAYSMEDDIDLNEPIQMDDISTQETSDVLEPARRVRFEIKTAKIRTRYDDENDKSGGYVKRLVLQVAIGPDGVDNEGGSANRRLFPEYVIAFSSGDGVRDSEWWKKKARGPVKELFAALGIELNPPPPIDQDFLDGLVSREFVADIIKREIERKTDRVNEKGKTVYEKTGEFANELRNHRSV
jgi:hypothetical protein